jgi:hypothetical protein
VTLRVTVTDIETGETGEREVQEGDYMVICAQPCYLDNTVVHANGTHQLTVKGRRKGL